MENIYVSLDEAREEIKKRWRNIELRKKVETELGDYFMQDFKDNPRSVLLRQICPADNGFVFYNYCAKYVNAKPLVFEYHDDIFVRCNEEKKGLGRLRVVLEDGSKRIVDVFDLHDNEKKKLGEIILKNGESLVEFHHRLIDILDYRVDMHDNSVWFRGIGKASDYYYNLMLHFVFHGVLFDVFQTEEADEGEDVFTKKIVLPALEKIKQKFGLKPLIIRLYPRDQTEEEDFYWWCYPPNINSSIIEYAREAEIKFKNY